MTERIIIKMASPMRDDFRVRALTFGSGAKTLALVGAMRGDEYRQLYIASQVARRLAELEKEGLIAPGTGITVIPCANPFSINIEKRFWAMDSTDINRMFPGYALGETTQRIAAALFDELRGYTYGLQLASFYVPGAFIPHVRMIRTGYEDVETAALLGLPYRLVRNAKPYDTTLLNYNWQIWDTKAYSLYAGESRIVSDSESARMVDSIIAFMARLGLLALDAGPAAPGRIVTDDDLVAVKAPCPGVVYLLVHPGDPVSAGDPVARITDPVTGILCSEVSAPVSGRVFFTHSKPVASAGVTLLRMVAG